MIYFSWEVRIASPSMRVFVLVVVTPAIWEVSLAGPKMRAPSSVLCSLCLCHLGVILV